MSDLFKKLQIRPGKKWLLFNEPDHYLPLLDPLPEGVKISHEPIGNFDGIQLFIYNADQLISTLKIITPLLKHDTVFWITYPKKSSGMNSGLEMMDSWDEPANYGLRVVTSISVNETWTALRFKPVELTRISDSRNDNIRKNDYGSYIDVINKQIVLPENMAEVLQTNMKAMAFYQGLSYANKKEYVLWILTAKQEKTRSERLVKLIEKLGAGKKNPGEK